MIKINITLKEKKINRAANESQNSIIIIKRNILFIIMEIFEKV